MSANSIFDAALNAEEVSGPLADLARSIYMQESAGGKNTKTSNRGAVGGMQVIPSTFASVADKNWDINDPLQNARAGIRYLKQLNQQAKGDPYLTAAGYYGGPGGLEKARQGVGVRDPVNPGNPNTLQYAAQVVARMPQQSSVAVPPTAAPDTQMPVQATAPTLVRDLDSAKYGAQEPTLFGFQPTPELIAALTPKYPQPPVSEDAPPVYRPVKAEPQGSWPAFVNEMPVQQSPVVDFSRWLQPRSSTPVQMNALTGFEGFGSKKPRG